MDFFEMSAWRTPNVTVFNHYCTNCLESSFSRGSLIPALVFCWRPQRGFLLSESHSGVIYIPALAWLDVQLFTAFSPLMEEWGGAFSADSSPERQIEGLHIPLTDVCDHCSSEIKWKRYSGQRFNSHSSDQVLRRSCCIGFGWRAGASVERSSLIWLEGQRSCVREFGGRCATNERWMNLRLGSWKSSQTEQLSLICSVWVMVLWWIGLPPKCQS